MSYNLGACGVFGILIHEYQDKIEKTYEEFIDTMNAAGDKDSIDTYVLQEPAQEFVSKFREAFKKIGIIIPDSPLVKLHYTGFEDERPAGRCPTPADSWVLGFGMYTDPWDYPEMDESFRKVSLWHTWVVGG